LLLRRWGRARSEFGKRYASARGRGFFNLTRT